MKYQEAKMDQSGNYQLDVVKALSFVRWGGTVEEEKAAKILTDEIKKVGGSYELMPFTIPAYECFACELSVTEPYQKKIEVVPHGRSGEIEGEYKFLYLERGEKIDYLGKGDLSDTIVMIGSGAFSDSSNL